MDKEYFMSIASKVVFPEKEGISEECKVFLAMIEENKARIAQEKTQAFAQELAKDIKESYEKEKKKMMKDSAQMNPHTVSTSTPNGRNIKSYDIDNVGRRLQKDFLQKQIKSWTDKGLGNSGMVQKTKAKAREISGRDNNN